MNLNPEEISSIIKAEIRHFETKTQQTEVGTVILVGDGIVGIVNAWMYARRAGRKGWWVLIVLNVLMILCGLVVLVNPWWNEPTMLFDVIGGMLLFSSIVSIVRLFYLWPIRDE